MKSAALWRAGAQHAHRREAVVDNGADADALTSLRKKGYRNGLHGVRDHQDALVVAGPVGRSEKEVRRCGL
jgi:hypothetical protein